MERALARVVPEIHQASLPLDQALDRLGQYAGVEFRVSCDNLVRPDPSPEFCAAIADAARRRLAIGLGSRAERLVNALCAASGRAPVMAPLEIG